jgi:hypothetical protein
MAKKKLKYYRTRCGFYRNGQFIPPEHSFCINANEKPASGWVLLNGPVRGAQYVPPVGAPPPAKVIRDMERTSVASVPVGEPGEEPGEEGGEPDPETLAEAQDAENREERARLESAGVDPGEVPRRATGSRSRRQ